MKPYLTPLALLIMCSAACMPGGAEVGTESPSAETQSTNASVPTELTPFSIELMMPGEQKAFSFLSISGEEIEYWLYLPEDYDKSENWPIMISLHGNLGFTRTLELVQKQTPINWIDPSIYFGYILISPKTPDGSWSLYYEPMEELINLLGESLSLNPNSVVLTGISTGAIGSLEWALTKPDRFSAIALVAGTPSIDLNAPVPEKICDLIDLPIWIGNSEDDERVPVEPNIAFVMALEECGSTVVHMKIYSDLGHMESIETMYSDPELYDWLVEQISNK